MRVEVRDARGDYVALLDGLAQSQWVDRVLIVGTCPSTNPATLDLSRDGSPALVIAESQTSGRGRRGARWHDTPGASALCSVAWRPPALEPDALGLLSLAAGVAAGRACRDHGARDAGVKWPNDVWSRGGKMGGVLVETRVAGRQVVAVVAGTGINVTTAPDAAGGHGARPTCLRAEGAATAEPPAVLARLLAHLSHLVARDGVPDTQAVRDGFEQIDLLRGQWVEASLGGRPVNGIAGGVDAAGRLLVRCDSGATIALPASAARVRPTPRAGGPSPPRAGA